LTYFNICVKISFIHQERKPGGELKGKTMASKRPPVLCFSLTRTPLELQPWILREDIFNPYVPVKRTLCQRTVYLTVLTLRALLQFSPYTVRWEISDDNGIGTYLHFASKQDGSKTELAEVICTNRRTLVRGVRIAPNPFTGNAQEFGGYEGLLHLLTNAAGFGQEMQTKLELPIVGGSNVDKLRELIRLSVDDDGLVGASFTHTMP
jgi:hypothetical protein